MPGQRLNVTAFAHDPSGAPLDGTATVTIDVPGLQPAGPVRHIDGNRFRRWFLSPSTPGTFRAEVGFNGFSVRVRPEIHFLGPCDPAFTAARTVPAGVRANSSDSFTLEVAPKDSQGLLLGAGHTVLAEIGPGSGEVALEDLGDGRYTGVFAAPATPGSHPIDVTIDGQLMVGLTSIAAGGAISAVETLRTYYEEMPLVPQMNPHVFPFILAPLDASKLPLGPSCSVQVDVMPDPGTEPLLLVGGSGMPQEDGDYWFALVRDEASSLGSASGTFTVSFEGVVVLTESYVF